MAVAHTRQRGGKRREQACDTSTSVTASGKAQLRRPAPKLQSLVPRAGSVSHADQPGRPWFCAGGVLFLCPACDPRAQGQERLESPFSGRLQICMAVLRLKMCTTWAAGDQEASDPAAGTALRLLLVGPCRHRYETGLKRCTRPVPITGRPLVIATLMRCGNVGDTLLMRGAVRKRSQAVTPAPSTQLAGVMWEGLAGKRTQS